MSVLPTTQTAIASPGRRAALITTSTPVHEASTGEVVVRVRWTASTPLDLHKADGGVLVTEYPAPLGGGGLAGEVVQVGDGDVKGLSLGDEVMAFAFRGDKEANHQEYVTMPAFLASKIPKGLSMEEASTIPVNLVTVFHTVTTDLGLELPWPIPEGYKPQDAEKPFLIWGASSSVGVFALQVLRHYGYRNIIAVASGQQHAYLKEIGATVCFDYRKPGVEQKILDYAGDIAIPHILDCIGSVRGTLEPLTKIAKKGSTVAAMLPVIVKDASKDEEPVYELDISKVLPGRWAEGVTVRGARTHFYLQVSFSPSLDAGHVINKHVQNEFFKDKLQPEIIPALVAQGVIKPNKFRIVQGETALERAQKALDLLRERTVSGERLVWKIAD